MIKKGLVAMLILYSSIITTTDKITPDQIQTYVFHEMEKQQEERLERMVWKAALTSSAITCTVGLITGVTIAWWMNRG